MLALKPAASDLCAAASVAAITDDQGTLIDQQRYLPFGKERLNVGTITQTDFGYTGQRDLPSMGLMDYNARFYDSKIGRFIQPDSIIPNPADPQSWNRYSYVQNSPIMFVDPTGHYEDEGCGMGESCELPPDDSPIIIEDEDEQDSGPSTNLVLDCFSDPGSCYMQGWNNFGSAWSIYSNTNAFAGDRILAGLYMGVWIDAHVLLAAGVGLAAYGAYMAVMGGASVCALSGSCANKAIQASAQGTERIVTVIGRWPANKQLASRIGGNWLNIQGDVWDAMSTAERWGRNKQWLQEAIIRGDVFRLASRISEGANTWYGKELTYLFENGYVLSMNQQYLYPPLP